MWGRFGRGRRFLGRSGLGRGFGYMRWLRAQEVGDPERAMFGLGPCGELAYQEYKKRKQENKSSSDQQ